MDERNWAGNLTYAARALVTPRTLDELQELVAGAERVRALGSRHSFTAISDTEGLLVSLAGLPDVGTVVVDPQVGTATVGAGAAYGAVAAELERQGWALATLASLPHISVAGAVATGTHGSGDSTGSLASAVAAIEYLDPQGEVRALRRGDPDFDGSVVALGVLGIVTRVTLDVEPTYRVRQDVFTGLSWESVEQHFDAITSTAHSTSMFTRFDEGGIRQAWFKSRAADGPSQTFGAAPATGPLHMLEDAPTESVTDQTGVPGPWLDRLPHFRMASTPSRGAELQSEYLVPRSAGRSAMDELRRLAGVMAPVLEVAEIRTVARDPLWLSSSYDTDVVAFHFTWLLDEPRVYAVLPAIEAALLPLGARPHWGKCFVARASELAPLYPRWDDFRRLRDQLDPGRKFGNAFLEGVLG
jgi:xylitol oxidase